MIKDIHQYIIEGKKLRETLARRPSDSVFDSDTSEGDETAADIVNRNLHCYIQSMLADFQDHPHSHEYRLIPKLG